MEYGYQKVMEVQRRCSVSFEDADRALKSEKGDVDKACVYAMRRKKNHEEMNKTMGSLKNFITYRVKISKNGKVKFDISMGIVLLVSLILFLFSLNRNSFSLLFVAYLVIFTITVFSGYTLEFVPGEKPKEDGLVPVAQKIKTEEEVYEENTENDIEPEEDGFNTIEIE